MDIEQFKADHMEAINQWKNTSEYAKGKKWSMMDWYKNYNTVLDKVAKIKSELLNGAELDIKNEEHKKVLKMLLLDECVVNGEIRKNGNGIASTGQAKLNLEDFDSLINNDEVLEAIKNIIINPTIEVSEQLESAFIKHNNSIGKSNSHLVINRIISACTDGASSTTGNYFPKIIKWFIDQEIIPAKHFEGTKTSKWYQQNIYLMTNLYKIFENEIKNGDTDRVFISMYIWHIYDTKLKTFRR